MRDGVSAGPARRAAALALLLGLAAAGPARAAEEWWSVPAPPDHVGIAVSKFDPAPSDPFEFRSTGWNFSVRSTIRPNLVLLIDVPAGHAAYDGVEDGDREEWAAGNAFLGAEFGSRAGGHYGQLGVRFPSAPDDRDLPLTYALFTDFQSPERYIEEYLTVSILGNFGGGEAAGSLGRFRIEPALLVPTGDSEGVEVLVRASLGGFLAEGPLWIGAGLSSLANLTADQTVDIDDILDTEFGLTVAARSGKLRPGAVLRLPLQGRRSEAIDAVFGLNLRWLL